MTWLDSELGLFVLMVSSFESGLLLLECKDGAWQPIGLLEEVLNFDISGEEIKAVHMLPRYSQIIVNLSDTEPLITLMWANELFDLGRPDTYSYL